MKNLRGEESFLLEDLDDRRRHLLGRREGTVAALLRNLHDDLRVQRFLVRVVDAGESLNLTRPRGFVQSFRIPLFANLFT